MCLEEYEMLRSCGRGFTVVTELFLFWRYTWSGPGGRRDIAAFWQVKIAVM